MNQRSVKIAGFFVPPSSLNLAEGNTSYIVHHTSNIVQLTLNSALGFAAFTKATAD